MTLVVSLSVCVWAWTHECLQDGHRQHFFCSVTEKRQESFSPPTMKHGPREGTWVSAAPSLSLSFFSEIPSELSRCLPVGSEMEGEQTGGGGGVGMCRCVSVCVCVLVGDRGVSCGFVWMCLKRNIYSTVQKFISSSVPIGQQTSNERAKNLFFLTT